MSLKTSHDPHRKVCSEKSCFRLNAFFRIRKLGSNCDMMQDKTKVQIIIWLFSMLILISISLNINWNNKLTFWLKFADEFFATSQIRNILYNNADFTFG